MDLPKTSQISMNRYPTSRTDKYLGWCVIIGQSKYTGDIEDTVGFDANIKNIKLVFKKLGFAGQMWIDYTGAELKSAIDSLAKRDFSEYDSLLIYLCMHGRDEILAANDGIFNSNYIIDAFKPSKCPKLDGKPKIFILETCRGTLTPSLTELTLKKLETGKKSKITLPATADFLVVFSTTPGHKTKVWDGFSSIFIYELCRFLVEFKDESIDFVALLLLVSKRVAQLQQEDAEKQVPKIVSTLTKKIFLVPETKNPDVRFVHKIPSDTAKPKIKVFEYDHILYFMDHSKRGRCVIINNVNFHPSTRFSPRNHGLIDGPKLAKAFEKHRFDTNHYHLDLTNEAIKKVIDKLAQQNFLNDDCLVICLLTYGDGMGRLYGSDGVGYNMKYIFEIFDSESCPTLTHKPKIFIIDASPVTYVEGVRKSQLSRSLARLPPQSSAQLPFNWPDCLIAYSSTLGASSFGYKSGGNFTESIMRSVRWKIINEALDLISILIISTKQVAEDTTIEGLKQMPEIVSSLTSRVCFTPCVTVPRLVSNQTASFEQSQSNVTFDFTPFKSRKSR